MPSRCPRRTGRRSTTTRSAPGSTRRGRRSPRPARRGPRRPWTASCTVSPWWTAGGYSPPPKTTPSTHWKPTAAGCFGRTTSARHSTPLRSRDCAGTSIPRLASPEPRSSTPPGRRSSWWRPSRRGATPSTTWSASTSTPGPRSSTRRSIPLGQTRRSSYSGSPWPSPTVGWWPASAGTPVTATPATGWWCRPPKTARPRPSTPWPTSRETARAPSGWAEPHLRSMGRATYGSPLGTASTTVPRTRTTRATASSSSVRPCSCSTPSLPLPGTRTTAWTRTSAPRRLRSCPTGWSSRSGSRPRPTSSTSPTWEVSAGRWR